MANIVLGIGSSHTPMLSTPPDKWSWHAERDAVYQLLGTDGEYHTFDELVRAAPPTIAKEITPEKFQQRFEASQRALARLGQAVDQASPDVLVIVGDDQEELFHVDNMPAFSVYWGDFIFSCKPDPEGKSRALEVSSWGQYPDEPTEYPAEPSLGRHIIERLIEDCFDVAHSREQHEGQPMSHAFTFVHRRLLTGRIIPAVPVWINTYYPPNQPRVGRCLEFGRSLRRAIESWDPGKRVCVLASGGLSHFVIDEQLDQTVLAALRDKDYQTLTSLAESRLRSGNSETKNWAALLGAVEHLDMQWSEYVPGYRSLAGTGCAMA
ncbi:MAG TPA: hypothetical protein VK457_12720, partial [Chloroflexota bacterium]|nr:hypothetical protein [Chloroflexota bacterium]